MIRNILLLSGLISCLSTQAQPTVKPNYDLWAIANEYLKAFEAVDFDKMGSFLHDSATFFDLGSSANGKQAIIQNWKTVFNPYPEKIRFEIGEHFVSGNFVVMNLRYEAHMKVQRRDVVVNMAVITVAKFKSDKIILLHDYPDMPAFYRQLANQIGGVPIDQDDHGNLEVVRNFYQAYAKWDVPTMTSFYADNIEFKDLTASDAFPNTINEHYGKEKVVAAWSGLFKENKPAYLNMELNSAYYSGDYVIANTTYSMVLPSAWVPNNPGKVFISMPVKTLFQLKNGKIVKHYDFADYDLFNQQIRAQK